MRFDWTIRSAGRVTRYHTKTMVQQQTVAEHTFNVLRIWLELYGPPSSAVSTYIILHDIGEEASGDGPHYAKRDYPELKEIMDKIEEDHVENLLRECCHPDNDLSLRPHISGWERDMVKLCDLIEMAEFAFDDFCLGNRTSYEVFENVEKEFFKIIDGRDHPQIKRAWDRLNTISIRWTGIGIKVIEAGE